MGGIDTFVVSDDAFLSSFGQGMDEGEGGKIHEVKLIIYQGIQIYFLAT